MRLTRIPWDPARRARSRPSSIHTARVLAALPVTLLAALPLAAQEHPGAHGAPAAADTLAAHTATTHDMWMWPVGGGWSVMAMGQAFPIVSFGAPGEAGSPLHDTAFYLTQPAFMANLESPGSRWTLRTTLNVEGVTQPDGTYTFGGWGEGFIDKRHPHTLLHELMLSWNLWGAPGGALSLSAGKGFAPYGTDDPMSRPVVKFPTNHHLSQILERWTVNGAYVHRSGLSLEAGWFGGAEPDGPYDFSNIESFGDSWSVRVAQRLGEGFGPLAAWEISASYGRVAHGDDPATHLVNAAIRHDGVHDFGRLYLLAEASRSDPDDEGKGFYSVLGEARVELGEAGRHQPYVRFEYATRPEFERLGPPGSTDFFRYDHHEESTDRATRWLIASFGYGADLTGLPVSLRPFVEAQYHRVRAERGAVEPDALFGTTDFWAVTAGFRIFFGGGPMRMGSYGVLDPMSGAMRM